MDAVLEMLPTVTQIEDIIAFAERLKRPVQSSEFISALGVGDQSIKRAVEAGGLEKLGRGVYKATSVPLTGWEAVAELVLRHPHVVISDLTAAAIHSLTYYPGHAVTAAVPRDRYRPGGTVGQGIPVQCRAVTPYMMPTTPSAEYGVEWRQVGGVGMLVTSPVRTAADLAMQVSRISDEIAQDAADNLRNQVEDADEQLVALLGRLRADGIAYERIGLQRP